jgi:TamB, inner membrane protein subunit of TAM complex
VDARLEGTLSGALHLEGSPRAPVIDGNVRWAEGKVGDQPVNDAFATVLPREDGPGFDVAVRLADPDGLFDLSGAIPLAVDLTAAPKTWSAGEAALELSGSVPLALAAAWSSQVEGAAGRLAVNGVIAGDPLSPVADLLATVDNGRVASPEYGIRAEDIEVRVRITGQTLTVEHADLVLAPYRQGALGQLVDSSERPRLTGTGSARLDEEAAVWLTSSVDLEDGPWLISTPDTSFRANGHLAAAGRWPALNVRGDLTVVQSSFNGDTTTLAATAPLTLDPSLAVIRGPQDAEGLPQPKAPPPPWYSAFDVEVNVDLQRNVDLALSVPVFDQLGRLGADLTSTDIVAELGGELAIEVKNGEPTLVGEVELLGGKVRMLRSTFDLQRGTITFAGGDPYADAYLDLSAVMNVPSGGTLELALTGTAAHPNAPVITSDEYPNSDEQMTILLTGRAPEDLTTLEGAGTAQLLAQTAFSNVLGGRSVGTLAVLPDGSVRLGVPVAPNFHAATVVSPFSTDPEANSLAVEAEWSIVPQVVLAGALGDRTSWADVFWEIRF